MQFFTQSEATAARRRVVLFLVDATDGITAETGEAGGQPQLSKAGAAWANTTATLTAIGNGAYYVELTAAELDTLGTGAVRYKSANTAEANVPIQVLAADLHNATSLGVSRLDAAVSTRSSHAAADVWAVATRQLTAAQTFSLTGDITGNLSGSVGSVTGAVGSVTGNVGGNVGGNVTGSVGSVAAGGITAASLAAATLTSAKFAAGAIDAAALATDAVNEVADGLLGRNIAGGSSAGRTVKQALAALRNRWTIAAGTLTVYDTDDATVLFTATITTAAGNPISGSDPA